MRAFTWENGVFHNIGTLPGGNYSLAIDINNLGQVVGTSGVGPHGGGNFGFIWDAVNGITNLGNDGGGGTSGINDNGQVVGAGYTWKDGVRTPLIDLIPQGSEWEFGPATDINNNGEIVGVGYNNELLSAYHMTPIPEPTTIILLGIGLFFMSLKKCRSN